LLSRHQQQHPGGRSGHGHWSRTRTISCQDFKQGGRDSPAPWAAAWHETARAAAMQVRTRRPPPPSATGALRRGARRARGGGGRKGVEMHVVVLHSTDNHIQPQHTNLQASVGARCCKGGGAGANRGAANLNTDHSLLLCLHQCASFFKCVLLLKDARIRRRMRTDAGTARGCGPC
jgi:hypothetical protein